jgi:hypothetical protein
MINVMNLTFNLLFQIKNRGIVRGFFEEMQILKNKIKYQITIKILAVNKE